MSERRTLIPAALEIREAGDDDDLVIEGYFAVYNSDYIMSDTASESIAPGAFSKSLGGDIRALINHDTTLVLGRTTAGTLEVREDDHGVYGRVKVNPNDRSALDVYARVRRGDVTQCSIGFEILDEDTDIRSDGSVHWTIKEATLFEVSICTFPAYESTEIHARDKDIEAIRAREVQAWRAKTLKALKGENDDA